MINIVCPMNKYRTITRAAKEIRCSIKVNITNPKFCIFEPLDVLKLSRIGWGLAILPQNLHNPLMENQWVITIRKSALREFIHQPDSFNTMMAVHCFLTGETLVVFGLFSVFISCFMFSLIITTMSSSFFFPFYFLFLPFHLQNL